MCYNVLMFILAQFFGILALLAYVVSMQQNNCKKVLLWRSVYNVMCGIQYLILGAWSGVICSLVAIARNYVFAQYKKTIPAFHVAFFVLLNFILGLVFYDGPISLLPVIHTMICTIYLARDDLTTFRLIQAFAATFMFIYNFSVKAYAGIIVVAVQFVCTLVGIARFDQDKIKKARSDRRRGRKK